VILNRGEEVGGGFETIPLGSNNIGEFTGCLRGIEQAKFFCNQIEVVGDCKILTEVAPKSKQVENYELNEILSEIRRAMANFKEVKFTHVKRELNKRADAIASAASWSEEDGMEAVWDKGWDPRKTQISETSEEWIILHSELWNWLNNPIDREWCFPIPKEPFVRKYMNKAITTNICHFPDQTAPDGSLIMPIILTDDIVKWFPEKTQPGAMFAEFEEIEKEKERKRVEVERRMQFGMAKPQIPRRIIFRNLSKCMWKGKKSK